MLAASLRHGRRRLFVRRRSLSDAPLGMLGAAELGGGDSRVQVTEYDSGGFEIGGDIYLPSSIVLLPRSAYLWRPQTVDDVTLDSMRIFTVVHPRPGTFSPRVIIHVRVAEIVILGLGESNAARLDDVVLAMQDEGIAVEQMDTNNAVHTFNILNDENRTVGAAILTLQPRGEEATDPFQGRWPS
mmetsp:Transcript_10717/g.35500  ORF Transcript_10717/g.35500 Transcript_10717/m.35500 type:complete len:185 (+) Transcript_10717:172-726(+)